MEVKVGSFADGRPRLSVFHWSSCKIAHLREDFVEASRPNLGRRPDPTTIETRLKPDASNHDPVNNQDNFGAKTNGAKIQTRPAVSASPSEESSEPARSRPMRTTRNKNPIYVDAMTN